MNFTLLRNQIWNMMKVVSEVSKSNEDLYLTCFNSDGKVILDSSNFYTYIITRGLMHEIRVH